MVVTPSLHADHTQNSVVWVVGMHGVVVVMPITMVILGSYIGLVEDMLNVGIR